MLVRVMDYNTMVLFRNHEPEREAGIVKLIRECDPDVLFVQELAAHTPEQAIVSARRLAAKTGLVCEIDRGPGRDAIYTVAKGSRSHAQAILWKKQAAIKPVADSWRVVKDMFWHALIILTLEVDGVLVDHACYHGAPRNGRTELDVVQWERETEARTIAALATCPEQPPLLIGGDWNSLSADRLENGEYYGTLRLPEEMDPAVKELELNRRASEILLEAGLIDIAAATYNNFVGRKLTTGHWPSDPYKGGTIDIFRGTAPMIQAVRFYDVITTPLAKASSDHLPSVVVYGSEALRPH